MILLDSCRYKKFIKLPIKCHDSSVTINGINICVIFAIKNILNYFEDVNKLGKFSNHYYSMLQIMKKHLFFECSRMQRIVPTYRREILKNKPFYSVDNK